MIGELAALGAALSWVVSSVLYRKALSIIDPFQANVIRLSFTSVFLIGFLAVFGKIGNLMLPSFIVLIAGFSGIIGLILGDILYMYGIKLVGVSRAVPLSCTYPLFNVMVYALLKGEEVEVPIIFGAFSIVVGIWLLSRQEASDSRTLKCKASVRGVASTLFAAVLWSASITLMNIAVTFPEAHSLDGALAVNAIRILTASIVLLTISLIFDGQFRFIKISKKIWLILACGGIVALAMGWFFLTFSFLHTQEAIAVPISSTTPFFSAIAGILFLDEQITIWVVLGSVFIVLGIFFLFI